MPAGVWTGSVSSGCGRTGRRGLRGNLTGAWCAAVCVRRTHDADSDASGLCVRCKGSETEYFQYARFHLRRHDEHSGAWNVNPCDRDGRRGVCLCGDLSCGAGYGGAGMPVYRYLFIEF